MAKQTKLANRATNSHVVHAELAQSLSHPNILVADEVYQDFQNFVHDQQQDDDVESPFGLSAKRATEFIAATLGNLAALLRQPSETSEFIVATLGNLAAKRAT
jgi:hypothetical protein